MSIIDRKKYEADSYKPFFAFWKEKLDRIDHAFSFKQRTVGISSGNYSTLSFSIDASLGAHIHQVTKNNRAALLTYVLGSFALLLKRYQSCDTVIIDVPVPVVFKIDETQSFRNYLRSLNGLLKETHRYADFPLQMLGESGSFKTNVLLYVEGVHPQVPETNAYNLVLKVRPDNENFILDVLYDDGIFDTWYITNFCSHYNTLLISLQNMDIVLHNADMITTEEKSCLIQSGTGTNTMLPAAQTIPEIFDLISATHTTAVIHNGNRYSYQYINRKADELAAYLITHAGVKAGSRVGVYMDRSEWLVIALMAIFKAAAVYVPIDVANSSFRRNFIIKDSEAVVLLTRSNYILQVNDLSIPVLALDEPLPSIPAKGALVRNTVSLEGYAYIMYTSGTTGVPKGVLIKQHSILNTIGWRNHYYGFSAKDTILQIPSIGFDSSIEDFLCALLSGAVLLMPDEEKRTNVSYLADLITSFAVTHLLITPSLYTILLDHLEGRNHALQSITIAGEAVSEELVKKHFRILPDVLLINEYGPAENSVCTTAGKLTSGEAITIGKPISNVYLYLLDNRMRIVPAGVPGEIYIGGAGLCNGYLSNDELNQALFVADPFRLDGTLLYKSGDVAQWLPDGNIQFLGRKDEQVKLNGIRIEPAEIETLIRSLDQVRNCKVIPHKNDDQTITLKCAIIPVNHEQSIARIRSACEQLLPRYMVPSSFVLMHEFPLTLNGKIDTKSILKLFEQQKTAVVLPSTEQEKLLAIIWASTIGVSPVGIHDNFFQIGGDSIKAIQIASRLYKEGFKIEVRDIFEKRTIHEIAKVLLPLKNSIDQSPVEGPLTSLTPLQKELFLSNECAHHFNQAIMLSSKSRITIDSWRAILEKLQEHHDALRITFHHTTNEWTAHNHGLQYALSIQEFDNPTLPGISNTLQKSIDLKKGPLVKTALLHSPDGDNILIVIHHTIIDGISWRILLEDIAILFEQIRSGSKLSLPPKTDSFKSWVEALHAYAQSTALKAELGYWRQILSRKVDHLKGDWPRQPAPSRMADFRSASIELDEASTRLLITEANIPFNTEVNDLLLVSLALSMHDIFSVNQFQLDLEGHGRENIMPNIDITRTVGWFTSICPVVLSVSDTVLQNLIIVTKEYLRSIPFHGIGYGILKHLTSLDVPARQSSLLFNYLGQFDEDTDNPFFSATTEHVGETMSGDVVIQYDFIIIGLIAGKKLTISIDFNSRIYRLETIGRLLDRYKENILRVIDYCMQKDSREITPSDTSSSEISMQDMEEIKSIFKR